MGVTLPFLKEATHGVPGATQKGRMAGVRRREATLAAALTKDEAHAHFKRKLASSKWEVLRGFHELAQGQLMGYYGR